MLHLNLSFPSFDSCLDFIEQICISGHVVSQREDVVLLLVATADLGKLEAVEVVVVFLVKQMILRINHSSLRNLPLLLFPEPLLPHSLGFMMLLHHLLLRLGLYLVQPLLLFVIVDGLLGLFASFFGLVSGGELFPDTL